MKYAVKLNVNGTADIVEVPDQRDWRWYSRQIGCEYIENYILAAWKNRT